MVGIVPEWIEDIFPTTYMYPREDQVKTVGAVKTEELALSAGKPLELIFLTTGETMSKGELHLKKISTPILNVVTKAKSLRNNLFSSKRQT